MTIFQVKNYYSDEWMWCVALIYWHVEVEKPSITTTPPISLLHATEALQKTHADTIVLQFLQ